MLFRSATIVMLLFSLFCTGCYGSSETDSIAYVMVIGVDKGRDGKQKVTFQTAVPLALGTDSEKKSSSQKPWITNTIEAPTPADSRMLQEATTSRNIKTHQMVAYIYSEEVAKEGINSRVSYASRNRNYREAIYIIVVKGSAEEYIMKNKTKLENVVARFYQTLLLTHNPGNSYLDADFHTFISRLKNNGGSPYATYTAINPMTGEDKPEELTTPEQIWSPYLAGETPRSGEANPVDFAGMAVFRGDKMVGTINSDETMALSLLTGKFKRSYIDVVDPLYPEKDYVSLNIYPEGNAKITTSIENNLPKISISLTVSGELVSVTSGTNYEAVHYRPLIENQIANMFKGQLLSMIKHTQELGTDPAGLGLYFRRNFSTTTELQQVDLTEFYKTAEIAVSVTAKIRRPGLIRMTTPLKTE